MKTAKLMITLTVITIFVLSLTPAVQAAVSIVLVDDGGENTVGRFTSLAIVNGFPAISYVDYTDQNLKYVRATDAAGVAWGTPVVVDTTNVWDQTKHLVVDGRPAIVYQDRSLRHLKFVRAADANGTAWDTPVTVDDSGKINWGLTAAVVNGKPAIIYDASPVNQHPDLMYVQASDAQGSSWQTPVTILSTGQYDDLSDFSMTVVDGNPAVAYYYYDNFGDNTYAEHAKYVRALDADGTTWGAPVTIDDESLEPSLAIVDGKPAVAYHHYDSYEALKFARALDAQGTAWGTPQILDDTEARDIGRYASLAIVNGIPTIAYMKTDAVGKPELRVIHAWDTVGDNWTSPTVIDTYAGMDLSLTEVGGAAGISYFKNNSLFYASLPINVHTVYLPLVIR